MAQIQTLKDRKSGETVYTVTSTKAVFDDKGVDLETRLERQRQATMNAFKDHPTKTEVDKDLAGKQDTLTPSADLQITDDNTIGLTNLAKMRLFCDMFSTAAGTTGYARITDGAFDGKLNGLTLTYEEALLIYIVTAGAYSTGQCRNTAIKTNLWTNNNGYGSGALNDTLPSVVFAGCTSAEVLRIGVTDNKICWSNDWYNVFTNCYRLREIIGIIGDSSSRNNTTPFTNCPMLEKVRIERLNVNIDLSPNPLINLDSLSYIVNHRHSNIDKALVITVHPDVYTKLTDGNNTEWHQVLTDALDKNITFATI